MDKTTILKKIVNIIKEAAKRFDKGISYVDIDLNTRITIEGVSYSGPDISPKSIRVTYEKNDNGIKILEIEPLE